LPSGHYLWCSWVSIHGATLSKRKYFSKEIGEKLALCKFPKAQLSQNIHIDDSLCHLYPP
jgi:hypothetical protein